MVAIRRHGSDDHHSAKHQASVVSTSPDDAAERHRDQALDEALTESFPASDPVAVNIAKPVRAKKKKKQPDT